MDLVAARDLVLEALTQAASQDAEILKPAEQKLKEWEIQPGFYSILFSVFSNIEIDVNVRWLAILYFKNGVDKYWRKTAPSAISECERNSLRQQLISTSSFKEPVNQLATQLAVVVSKVARIDCPREWPELIPTLMEKVRREDNFEQQRALLITYHVTKALSSKRLAGDRRLFQDLTLNIFEFILKLWLLHNEQVMNSIQLNDVNLIACCFEKMSLTLKILSKLVVHGFKDPDKNSECVKFLSSIFGKLKFFLQLKKSFQNKSVGLFEKCEKYVIQIIKVLTGVLEYHPFAFVNFITPSLEFTVMYVFTETGSGLLFEKFIVYCFNLIKGILLCAEYRPAKICEETKNPLTLAANKTKLEFFTEKVLSEICKQLLSHYFLLTEEDLSSWEDDPEGFAIDEGGESWKYSLRPCTEVLFLSLFHEFRQQITPVLLELMNETSPMCNPADIQAILKKEAIYNAVGLAAFELYDEVDFDQWFLNTLQKELMVHDSSYKIIRRRVICLIGQWIGVKLSSSLRPEMYKSIIPLLQENEDFVVRLATANTLKVAVDDFEFSVDQFLPYLETSFGLLYKLLTQVVGCDTRMQVLYVMSFVIERAGNQIRPHAANLVQYLPLLWNESADHNMLRCAIITTLVHLVQGLGPMSKELHPFLIGVIQYSVEINQEPHVYLLDEGLELWWVVLDNADTMSGELLDLFQCMPSLIEYTADNLLTCLNIIQAHALLDPVKFVKSNPEAVAQACLRIFSDLKSEGIVSIMSTVEEILRIVPEEGPQIFNCLLPRIFMAVVQAEEYPMVMSGYLAIIGRVALQNPKFFYSLQNFIAQEQTLTSEQVYDSLLEVWFDKLNIVTQMERRKLLALSLASFLLNGSNVTMNKVCGILLACVEVLNDLVRPDSEENDGTELDSLLFTENDNVPESELETEHDKRKRSLSFQDPVHTVVLCEYLRTQLNQLEMCIGAQAFKDVMDTVDVETMQQLKVYINLIKQ